MLNPELHLNQNVFDAQSERHTMREGFGQGLLDAGIKNQNIVALAADLRDSVSMNKFADQFPDRFFEMGVAEQGMVTVASGLAATGKIPFTGSYATFSPGRNWEQIRTTICYNDMPVKIVGSHAGLLTSPDGATHQALEDIAMMRALPNMVVVAPCDTNEAYKAALAIAENKKPSYLRVMRPPVPVITTEKTPFRIGRIDTFWKSEKPKATICATGDMVYFALCAAMELEQEGIGVEVLNVATIKPLDVDAIVVSAKKTKAVVTVEDHQRAGGMGSAVAEALAQTYPVRMRIVGVNDQFGQSGTPEDLIMHYGLGQKFIAQAVREAIAAK